MNIHLNYIRACAMAAFAAVGLTACDSVDESDRLIKLEDVKIERTVLLEDFTGQKCVNCPKAHETIEGLSELYGDALVAVSIHAGGSNFGISVRNGGLMQTDGQRLALAYGIESYPSGVVNEDGVILTQDQWAAAVRDALEQPTDASVSATAIADNDSIYITSTVKADVDMSACYTLWVIESNIVATQQRKNDADGSTETIPDYVHNNVWRASVTPLDGEAITVSEAEPLTLTHSIALKKDTNETWVVDNLAVVSIITEPSGRNVINCTRAAVTQLQEE